MSKPNINIPKTSLIELCYDNASVKISKSEWINAIPNPVIIKEGDTVQMKQAFINTGNANSTEFIKVLKDVHIELKFGIYIVNTSQYARHLQEGLLMGFWYPQTGDFLYMVDRDPNDPQNYQKYVVHQSIKYLVVQAGTYTFQEIASNLTNQLAMYDFKNSNGAPMYQVVPTDNFSEGKIDDQGRLYDPGNYLWCDEKFPPGSAHWFIAELADPNPDDPHDHGDPNPLLGQYMFFGASQPAILYESGIFKISLFTPPVADSDGDWAVKWEKDKNGDNLLITTESGCFITDITDDYYGGENTFFSSVLGFDLDKIIIKPGITTKTPNSQLISEYTSRLYAGVDLLYNVDDQSQGGFYGLFRIPIDFKTTTIYTPLNLCSSENSELKGGYYLVTINTMHQTQVYGQEGKFGVTGIISKQYNQTNVVTGYSDSSSIYVHKGDPISLEQFNICIVDPITRQPASATNIGDSQHAIYLEVTSYNE